MSAGDALSYLDASPTVALPTPALSAYANRFTVVEDNANTNGIYDHWLKQFASGYWAPSLGNSASTTANIVMLRTTAPVVSRHGDASTPSDAKLADIQAQLSGFTPRADDLLVMSVGLGDILVNNIAWLLRRFPVFGVFGNGNYRLQPIYVDDLARIVASMDEALGEAGANLVTGDTKVMERGALDGIAINTAGIGVVPAGIDYGPHRLQPGDAILVSGPIGLHGIAVMSVRAGLEFGSAITSDTAPLNGIVAALQEASIDVRMLRDPTRGGVAASLNEIARSSGTGMEIVERSIPVPDDVRAACEMLGLDPLYVANEGILVAVVAGDHTIVISGRLGIGTALSSCSR